MGKKNKKSNKSSNNANNANNAINNNDNNNPSPSNTTPTTVTTTTHQQSASQKQTSPTTSTTPSTTDHQHHSHAHTHYSHQHTKSSDQESQQNNEVDEQPEEQKGFKGQAKKDMKNVEGYVADREGEVIDETKLNKALTFVNEENQRQKAQRLKKQKEAEKIAVSKEDIDFIINEMEVTKQVADKYLRENNGNIVEALKAMVTNL